MFMYSLTRKFRFLRRFTFIIHLWFIKLKQSPALIKLRKSV